VVESLVLLYKKKRVGERWCLAGREGGSRDWDDDVALSFFFFFYYENAFRRRRRRRRRRATTCRDRDDGRRPGGENSTKKGGVCRCGEERAEEGDATPWSGAHDDESLGVLLLLCVSLR